MKTLLKILGTIVGIALLLIIVGFIQTYRVQHSPTQEQFLAGKTPSPFPDGFQKGSADFYTSSWQGKTFDANSGTGINNFGTEQKYPFNTYTAKGLQDKDLAVFKIDYQNGQNSWWVSPILDEIVEVAPGQYLGKIHYRLIPGYPFAIGYFRLENPNGENGSIYNITVSGKYFSLKLPQNWNVDFNDAREARLTEMIALSPDFKGHEEKSTSTSTPETLNYFESGAKLDILVEKGLIKAKEKLTGTIIASEDITIAGIKTKLMTITEPTTKVGQFLDARFGYEGNSYVFRMAYNPEKFPEAKQKLTEFLSFFKFPEVKK